MANKPTSIKIQVDGLSELQKALREAGGDDLKAALKEVNKEAAEVVAATARSRVPVRSGSLLSSLRTSATLKSGVIRIGKAKVPYAGPIHFGWPKRHIHPQPFLYDSLDARYSQVIKIYEDRIDKLLAQHFKG